jgi:Tfp pilus assembly protein PilF
MPIIAGISLTGLVGWAFLPCLSNEFVSYDDYSYVTENHHVQAGITLSSLAWAFGTFSQANWHPLTWLSHMLDFQFYGLHPAGHHATSVLLHGLNSVLLFGLLRLITGASWRSFFVAAFFSVHPLHVESVAWVSERKDVLSGTFFMLTLLAYVRYARVNDSKSAAGRAWYWGSVVACAAGLMCKPMLVTVPFVLVLIEYWPLERLPGSLVTGRPGGSSPNSNARNSDGSSVWFEKIPFLVLSVSSSIITVFAQRSGGTVAVTDALPVVIRLENALVAWCRYLGKIFWPMDLAVFYPYPTHWQPLTIWIAALLLASLTGCVFVLFRRRYPVTGWLWFLGMLVPVIGLVQVGGQSMADRYAYLPSTGIFVACVWGFGELSRERGMLGPLLVGVGAVLVMISAGLCRQQAGYWKNTETLFTHALKVTQGNYVAYASLGNYELREKNQPARAVGFLEKAVAFKPDFAEAYNNLGYALYLSGRIDEARIRFQQAIEQGYDLAHVSLGVIFASRGKIDEALQEFEIAVRLHPDSAEAQSNLGVALHAFGRREEAEQHLRRALELHPHFPQAEHELNTMTQPGK